MPPNNLESLFYQSEGLKRPADGTVFNLTTEGLPWVQRLKLIEQQKPEALSIPLNSLFPRL